MNVAQIASALREHPSIRSKLAISSATETLGLAQMNEGRPGDDAAILPRKGGGFDLLAGEGFIPGFVKDDPWFAGWCGVMVNVSDIASMGGRAVGVVDQVWAPDADTVKPLLQGLRDAANALGVPVVGGHSNFSAGELGLAVSIFGRAEKLITSFDAAPGDVLIAAADLRGAYRNFDNFFAAGDAPAGRVQEDFEVLPCLAEDDLVKAGKDISQGGLVGTALMLAECSGVGIEIDLERIESPRGVALDRWLRSYPSFGFLLSVAPEKTSQVCDRFNERDIDARPIGVVSQGAAVHLRADGESTEFWNYRSAPYLGLGVREMHHA